MIYFVIIQNDKFNCILLEFNNYLINFSLHWVLLSDLTQKLLLEPGNHLIKITGTVAIVISEP